MRTYFASAAQSYLPRTFLAGLLASAPCAGGSQHVLTRDIERADAFPAFQFRSDASRDRSWVLNRDAVYVYDGQRKRLILRIELPGWLVVSEAFSCPPELLVTAGGAALVTSNIVPTIWEIDPASFDVRQHQLALDADHDKDVGFTALTFDRSGKELIGVSSLDGSIWWIDLESDRARKTRLPKAAPDACGSIQVQAGASMTGVGST